MNSQTIKIIFWFALVAIVGALAFNWEYTLWLLSVIGAFYIGYKYGRRAEKWNINHNGISKNNKNMLRNMFNNIRLN